MKFTVQEGRLWTIDFANVTRTTLLHVSIIVVS